MTLLTDAVELLRAATPDLAGTRAAVGALRARHPGSGLRLLWQREAYDGSVHYDLLLREPDAGGTVSLSWCPDDDLPWPLRGVQRGGEMLLVRVDGVALEVADAVAYLDVLWRSQPLRDRLVDACVVRAAIDGDELDDEDLQVAADAFRRARDLLTPEATRAWMERERLSDEQFEDLVTHQALVARLRARVTAGAGPGSGSGAARHDRLRIVRVERPSAAEAERLAAAPDLLAAAAADFAAGTGPAPTLETVTRAELPDAGEVGSVVGPIATADRFLVAAVLAVEPATADSVSRALFAEWLAERRAAARVEWNWGPRD
ncbi:TIGR04500 family putative peptide maturation system protein [Dactylosporangium sp. NPDC005555]|uniref:TIGR04500 family putative peptide maturation system protein n=1 Tax=Dactylosporangium sp. NPDC005555 TaxID=3154889 RepID=UPI0033A68183